MWRDETGLRWGDDWPRKLKDQIRKTELFFVLLSPSWIKSQICRDELTAFLDRETAQGWSGRIFVAQIRGISPTDPDIDDQMWALLRGLDTRQKERWRFLLDEGDAAREQAWRTAGEDILHTLLSIKAAAPTNRPSPPQP